MCCNVVCVGSAPYTTREAKAGMHFMQHARLARTHSSCRAWGSSGVCAACNVWPRLAACTASDLQSGLWALSGPRIGPAPFIQPMGSDEFDMPELNRKGLMLLLRYVSGIPSSHLPVSFPSSACPIGSFKGSVGDAPCRPCPAHSHTTVVGSSECACQNRYYRSTSDTLDAPCTGKSLAVGSEGEGR